MPDLHCPNCDHLIGRMTGAPAPATPSTDHPHWDHVSHFLLERTSRDAAAYVPVATMREAYLDWCQGRREPVSAKALTLALVERGLTRVRSKSERGYAGVHLI